MPRCTIPSSSNSFECCSNLGGNPVEAVSTPIQATDLDLAINERHYVVCCVRLVDRRATHVGISTCWAGVLFISRPEPYTSIPVNASLHAQDEGGDCYASWVGETKAPFIGGHVADKMGMQED